MTTESNRLGNREHNSLQLKWATKLLELAISESLTNNFNGTIAVRTTVRRGRVGNVHVVKDEDHGGVP